MYIYIYIDIEFETRTSIICQHVLILANDLTPRRCMLHWCTYVGARCMYPFCVVPRRSPFSSCLHRLYRSKCLPLDEKDPPERIHDPGSVARLPRSTFTTLWGISSLLCLSSFVSRNFSLCHRSNAQIFISPENANRFAQRGIRRKGEARTRRRVEQFQRDFAAVSSERSCIQSIDRTVAMGSMRVPYASATVN